MMLLAKAALGLGSTLVPRAPIRSMKASSASTVDEYRAAGSHVHMWLPAPQCPWPCISFLANKIRHASEQASESSARASCHRQRTQKVSGCGLR